MINVELCKVILHIHLCICVREFLPPTLVYHIRWCVLLNWQPNNGKMKSQTHPSGPISLNTCDISRYYVQRPNKIRSLKRFVYPYCSGRQHPSFLTANPGLLLTSKNFLCIHVSTQILSCHHQTLLSFYSQEGMMFVKNIHILKMLCPNYKWHGHLVLFEHVKVFLSLNLVNHEGGQGSQLNIPHIWH